MDFNESRSEKVKSISNTEIYIKGFQASDTDWQDVQKFNTVSLDNLYLLPWIGVEKGDIVALINSEYIGGEDNTHQMSIDLSKNIDVTDEMYFTDTKPYRVIGFNMNNSDGFPFTVFLDGSNDPHMIGFALGTTEHESGLWNLNTNKLISNQKPTCAILSDRAIAEQFDCKSTLVSNRI